MGMPGKIKNAQRLDTSVHSSAPVHSVANYGYPGTPGTRIICIGDFSAAVSRDRCSMKQQL